MNGHLEKSVEEREELCPGEPRHNSIIRKGDVLASSQGQEDLINNETRCYSKEKISKTKEAHTAPPLVAPMSHSPPNQTPTRSTTRIDPPRGHQTAAPSAQPRLFEDSCLPGLEESKLRHNDAVNDRRSNANAKTKRKLMKSSVEPRERGKRPGSPSKV